MENTLIKINNAISEYNSLFSKNEFYPLQKAYTTPHFVVLQVRAPGKTHYIYIGRGNQYVGCFVYHKAPPPYLRIQDRFLDFVRSHVLGAKLSKIDFDEHNSRYKIKFKTDVESNFLEFGYFEREMYFVLKEKELFFTSWNNNTIDYTPTDYPESEVQKCFYTESVEKYLKNEEGKSSGEVVVKKREKFLIKKIINIESDLKNTKDWSVLESMILNDELDLNGPAFEFGNFKISFIGIKEIWDKKDLVFKRIKKLKRGELILQERLLEAKEELKKIKSGEVKVSTTKEKAIQVFWKTKTKIKNDSVSRNDEYLQFQLFGLRGFLGLSSGGNDKIRSLASKDHYWFHIENYPGSHLILKTDDLSKVSLDTFHVIASVLRDYSKIQITEIPIMYTQVKNLKGIKGVKGEVTMKKVKYMTCHYRDFKEIISIV